METSDITLDKLQQIHRQLDKVEELMVQIYEEKDLAGMEELLEATEKPNSP